MFIIGMILSVLLFYFFCYWFAIFVEGYFEESSPFKKWWRKHIVDWDPDELIDRNDRGSSGIS